MQRVKGLLSTIILVFTIPMFTHLATADDIASQVNVPYKMFKLDNGLTTLVHTDHSNPTVFVGIWYGVGSKDEPAGKTGFAHLFEHLMFQGTANRKGEYFSPFTKAGATGINGTTWFDRTNYYATVPTGALDMALWMESDRMSHLLGAVTQEVLDEQRSVVKNEKRQSEDGPFGKVNNRLLQNVFPLGHPYHHETIGSMDDLNKASLEDIHAWFKKYYGASNAILVLSGDISYETANEKVAHYFADAPAGSALVKQQQWIPIIDGVRKETVYDQVGETVLNRHWPIPGLNDRDSVLMYIVSQTLAGNKNSPLRQKLVDELKLANSVRGSATSYLLSGIFDLTISLKPDVDVTKVNAVIDEVISQYLKDGPDEDLLENIKLRLTVGVISSLESQQNIGLFLAEGQMYSNDPLHVNQELKWLNDATIKNVRAAARRWLSKGYFDLTVAPFPKAVMGNASVDRSKIPAIAKVSNITFPDVETATLKNGMKLVVANRGDVPFVHVSFEVNTGAMADSAQTSGMASDVFSMLNKGTKKYDANELAAAQDKIAMSARGNGRLETSGVYFQIFKKYLSQSIAIAAEMLRNPTFPEEELQKLNNRSLSWIATRDKNPASNARRLFNKAIYGDKSPLSFVQTKQTVNNFNRDDFVSFYQREVTPGNMTVYMIGDISINEARSVLQKSFGKWKAANKSRTKEIGTAKENKPRVILIDQPDATQSTIIVGHAISAFDAAGETELTAVNAIFGGNFEARINMNIREDKGWSYGIRSSLSYNARGDRTLKVSGKVQTDKTMESMVEIKKEFKEFVSTRPATDAELNIIKLNQTRSLPGQFATNVDYLQSIIRSGNHGVPYSYDEGKAGRIAKLTLTGINKRARSVFKPNALTWVIAGDLSKIEKKIRSLNYGEIEVWDGLGNKIR